MKASNSGTFSGSAVKKGLLSTADNPLLPKESRLNLLDRHESGCSNSLQAIFLRWLPLQLSEQLNGPSFCRLRGISDPEFFVIGVVSVRRSEQIFDCRVVLASLILISNQKRNRRSGSFTLVNPERISTVSLSLRCVTCREVPGRLLSSSF